MGYMTLQYAKELLKNQSNTSLLKTSYKSRLSGNGRLHDLFINIEAMTPGEYKNWGKNLSLSYSFHTTLFGNVFIASTDIWICYMAFHTTQQEWIKVLTQMFPNAKKEEKETALHFQAVSIFNEDSQDIWNIRLHLKWTPFQLKVWEALLRIPGWGVTTYKDISTHIWNPNGSRATGSAIGKNPVAYLIPCHRVIQKSWHIGGYMRWPTRKSAILWWERGRE